MFGLAMAAVGASAIALAPWGWLVFPIAFAMALEAVTYPSLNSLMSRRAAPEQQGELQGAIASLSSLAAIVGPALMTGAFAHFASRSARPDFPGAPFALAALLDIAGLGLLFLLGRPRVASRLAAGPERSR